MPGRRQLLGSQVLALACFVPVYVWRANMDVWTWRTQRGFFLHDYGMLGGDSFGLTMQRLGGFAVQLLAICALQVLVARRHLRDRATPAVWRCLQIGAVAGLWSWQKFLATGLLGFLAAAAMSAAFDLSPQTTRFAALIATFVLLARTIASVYPAIPVAVSGAHRREGWKRAATRLTQGQRTRYFVYAFVFLVASFWSHIVVERLTIGTESMPEPMQPTLPALDAWFVFASIALGVLIDAMIALAWAWSAVSAYRQSQPDVTVFE